MRLVTYTLNQSKNKIHYLCPLITNNWLEEVLPVGQRVQASGFRHSQQVTERKELAQHAQKLLVPAENKTKLLHPTKERYNPQNGCTLGFKFAVLHLLSLVYSPVTLQFRSLQSYHNDELQWQAFANQTASISQTWSVTMAYSRINKVTTLGSRKVIQQERVRHRKAESSPNPLWITDNDMPLKPVFEAIIIAIENSPFFKMCN